MVGSSNEPEGQTPSLHTEAIIRELKKSFREELEPIHDSLYVIVYRIENVQRILSAYILCIIQKGTRLKAFCVMIKDEWQSCRARRKKKFPAKRKSKLFPFVMDVNLGTNRFQAGVIILDSRTNPFEEWGNDTCMRRVKLHILDKKLKLFDASNKAQINACIEGPEQCIIDKKLKLFVKSEKSANLRRFFGWDPGLKLSSGKAQELVCSSFQLKEADTPSASSFIEAPFSSTSALLAQLKLNNPEVAETHLVQERVSYEHVDSKRGVLHLSMHMRNMCGSLGMWKRPWHKPSMWLAQPAPFPPSFPSQMESAYNFPRSATYEKTTFRQVTLYHTF
ncbi:hypothetical protein GQ457_16G018510 [Hibiscus cannabinus]